MAWRPSVCLIEGELDNTALGKVTGWIQFAGMDDKVHVELEGDFHRDIRGAKIRIRGNGQPGPEKARGCMSGFAPLQHGKVGDITAGLPPQDYVDYPYIEWYSDENGRVVIELAPEQIEVIGTPIPACESDPVSREAQARNLAGFLAELGRELRVPAIAISGAQAVSDPGFTHWVVAQGRIIGEAREVEPESNGTCFAFVRLFAMPECAEYGSIPARNLKKKEAMP